MKKWHEYNEMLKVFLSIDTEQNNALYIILWEENVFLMNYQGGNRCGK